MSKPSANTSANVFTINLPEGWYATVSGITRQPYQHLITAASSFFPNSKTFLKNDFGKTNQIMTDVRGGLEAVVFAAQAESSTLTFNFYRSKTRVPKSQVAILEKPEHRSFGLQYSAFPKPPNSPPQIPDYVMYTVFVEDDADHVRVGKAYDDAVLTIQCVKADSDQIRPVKPGSKYNLSNIQAEVVPGLTKAYEYFFFFQIKDITHFRQTVGTFILPKIPSAEQILLMNVPPSGLPVPNERYVGLSVGFSATGLNMLGLYDNLNDEAFKRGQLRDAKDLGDSGTERDGVFYPDWDVEFKADIHGIFQITAHNDDRAKEFLQELEEAFTNGRRSSIKKILVFRSQFRPAPLTLLEHFGFRDGISRPEVEDVTFNAEKPMRFPGAPVVPLGLLVMGYDGDVDKNRRPPWATDGSFLVFRKLKSLVPEFHDFVNKEAPLVFPNLPRDLAITKFGSRLFGRWQSGVPIALSPNLDDPVLAKDDSRLNNFDYESNSQSVCPFAAHTRKSYARGDTQDSATHLFRRASIPYGPEVNPDETNGTIDDRGLIFVCYQSSIERGFKFIQKNSFNTANYPPRNPEPGLDPIAGQTGREKESVHRFMSGLNPNTPADKLSFPIQFVESSGGEYFFMPSINTLRTRVAV